MIFGHSCEDTVMLNIPLALVITWTIPTQYYTEPQTQGMEGWHGKGRASCQHGEEVPGVWCWMPSRKLASTPVLSAAVVSAATPPSTHSRCCGSSRSAVATQSNWWLTETLPGVDVDCTMPPPPPIHTQKAIKILYTDNGLEKPKILPIIPCIMFDVY